MTMASGLAVCVYNLRAQNEYYFLVMRTLDNTLNQILNRIEIYLSSLLIWKNIDAESSIIFDVFSRLSLLGQALV